MKYGDKEFYHGEVIIKKGCHLIYLPLSSDRKRFHNSPCLHTFIKRGASVCNATFGLNMISKCIHYWLFQVIWGGRGYILESCKSSSYMSYFLTSSIDPISIFPNSRVIFIVKLKISHPLWSHLSCNYSCIYLYGRGRPQTGDWQERATGNRWSGSVFVLETF